MTSDRIAELKELTWTFDGRPPRMYFGVSKWKASVEADPCPCFHHDPSLVQTTLEFCDSVFPLPNPPTIYIAHFEGVGRSNGETHGESHYIEKTEHDEFLILSTIILFGKRTPIHPAMTRYLVAHEYGHAVERAISQKLFKGNEPSVKLMKEYSEIRKIENSTEYGPGKWSTNPREVFANDFRMLIPGIEKEFWPHPAQDPREVPDIVKWWEEIRKLDLTTIAPKSES